MDFLFLSQTALFREAKRRGIHTCLDLSLIHIFPEERKARSMSMLHSFFAWGQIFVVLATTGLLAVWGAARWQWIVLLWAAPPVAGAALFLSLIHI